VNTLVMPGVTCAYANWARWVASCSYAADCGDAAAELTRFQEGFICSDCGRPNKVVWPAAETVYGVERLLMMRSHVKHRNWYPGETLIDLMTENAANGVFDTVPANPGDSLLQVEEGRIVHDALPASPTFAAVTA
jgi:hypothetical protein